jgi:rod shape-determining protein MreD
MAELSYTSRREIDQYGFHPAVTLLAPLGCILLQAVLPRIVPRLGILDLPLIATIFFAVARRSPIAGAVTGSLIGLVQDGLTNHPFGVNGITKALIGYGAASLGFAVDVDNMLNRAMLLFSFSLVQSLLLYILPRARRAANRIRKVPVLAPRGKHLRPRRPHPRRQLPSVTCYLLREQVQRTSHADLPLIARGLISRRPDPGHAAPLPAAAQVRAHPAQAGHHPRRAGLHRGAPQRAARARDPRRAAPPLSPRRLRRPPDRLRRRGLRGRPQQLQVTPSTSPATSSASPASRRPTTPSCAAPTARATSSSTATARRSASSARSSPPRQDLRLTIDLDVQMAAEQALEGKNGAIVAMDPHTGEILAMVSRPTFDPNQFAVRLTKATGRRSSTTPTTR